MTIVKWLGSTDGNHNHRPQLRPKDNARSFVGNDVDTNSVGIDKEKCGYPECYEILSKESKGCPCWTVKYCSKDCQRAHWPGEFCSLSCLHAHVKQYLHCLI